LYDFGNFQIKVNKEQVTGKTTKKQEIYGQYYLLPFTCPLLPIILLCLRSKKLKNFEKFSQKPLDKKKYFFNTEFSLKCDDREQVTSHGVCCKINFQA